MNALSTWSVTYLMHSALLIALATLAARFIRSASVRDTLWKIALLGGIATATLQNSLPIERALPEAAPQRMTITVAEPVEVPPAERSAPSPSSDAARAIAGAWAGIALLLCARIVAGRRRFLRIVAGRTEILTGTARTMLDAVAERAGYARPVRLTACDTIGSPVAMLGWEIVVPARVFARLSEEQQETILAHEMGHLLRRDPLWLTIAECVKALLFFQPLNWFVAARLRETAEFLCDDAAVLQTGNQRALAETLAELAAHATPAAPAIAAMHEGGSNLVVRVTRVLRAHPRVPVRLGVRVAMAMSVLAVMVLFAPGFATASADSKKSTWNASVSYSNDEAKTRIRIRIRDLHYDAESGEIDFDDGGFVSVVERVGDRERSWQLRDGRAQWSGSWDDEIEPRAGWLRRMLREQTDMRDPMIDALLRR